MKTTLKQKILSRFLVNWKQGKQGFVHSQVIEDYMHVVSGQKHETVGRRLRELAEEGKIEKKLMPMKNVIGETVCYRYIPSLNDLLSLTMQSNERTN